MSAAEFFSGLDPAASCSHSALRVGGLKNRCNRLTIETDDGIFEATKKNLHTTREHFGGQAGSRCWLRFHPISAHFVVKGAGPAEYWALPLTNFASEFALRHGTLDRHVLRVFPTPIVPDIDFS